MTDPAPVWTPAKAYTPTDAVEALLDAAFDTANYGRCACGAMIDARSARCWPCVKGNRARGPIYGASLAGHQGAVVYMGKADPLPYPLEEEPPCESCATANERIDGLLEQNDALSAENLALAQQVVALKGHCEELAAAVRAGKHGTGG